MRELNKLYNLDCMEGMRDFPDNYFDLAIVDPPYGIGSFQQSDRGNYTPVDWNNKIPDDAYFKELIRISTNRIIWGANYFNCFETGSSIVWDKLNQHPSMSRCEIASKSWGKKIDYFEYEWHGYIVKREDNNSFHPCQKPVQLYKWLLNNYAKPDMKIIDTHAGSCSSVIAFEDFGCDWIAFEIDKEYYEAALKRIEIHKQQLKLAI